jgi:hypothetical protein
MLSFLLQVFDGFLYREESLSDVANYLGSSNQMNIRNKRLSPFALILMFCAALTFSLATAVPSKAQDSTKEFEPIGATPGAATPVAPPKKPEKDATNTSKSSDQAKPKATGVGASAGGTGSSATSTVGGVSLKKVLIIGASAVGVLALLAAGGGGGGGGNGGSTGGH